MMEKKTVKSLLKNGTVKDTPNVRLRDYYPKEGIRKLASKSKRIFDTDFTYSKRAKLKVKKDEPIVYVVEPNEEHGEVVKYLIETRCAPIGNSVIYGKGENARESVIPILKKWEHLSEERVLKQISIIESNSEVEPREFTNDWVSRYSNEPLTNMRKAVPESERITIMTDGTRKRELLDTATGLPIRPKDESNAVNECSKIGWAVIMFNQSSIPE